MTQRFVNNFATTVAQTFGPTDTYLRVASPVGLPVLGAGDYLLLTVFRKVGQDESGHEVVKVTAITADLLTVERAVEGAAASMFLTGDRVEGRLTAMAMHNKADVADLVDAYTHPATHPASMLEQDENNRLVTDAEKALWNAKQPAGTYATGTGSVSGTNTGDETTATIKSKLGITTLSGSNTGDQVLPTLASLGGQPVDADLTAIAALTGTTGLLKKTAANTWVLDTAAYTTNTGTVTGVSGTTPIVSSGGTTPVISISAATTSAAGSMSAADKTKLDGIAAGATAYVHPANHPASVITQDANNRFVTDTEKSAWNAKQAGLVSGTTIKTIGGQSLLGGGDITAGGAITGDVLTTTNPLSAPDWLPCSGGLYLKSSYPNLVNVLTTIAAWKPAGASSVVLGVSCVGGKVGGADVFVSLIPNTNICKYSTDGITWTEYALPTSKNWSSVAYGGVYNGYMAVASGSNIAISSTDGITWNITKGALPHSGEWSSITCHAANGLWVAVAQGSSTAATSATGWFWAEVSLPAVRPWRAVASNGQRLVAVAYDTSAIVTSVDGTTWVSNATNLPWGMDVIFGNGVFLAVGYTGATRISTDGLTWQSYTGGAGNRVAAGNGVFSSPDKTSIDGITWTNRITPISSICVLYGNGAFWAYGNGGSVPYTLTIDATTAKMPSYNPATHFAVPSISSIDTIKTYIKA